MRKRSIPGKRVTVTSGSRVRISVTPLKNALSAIVLARAIKVSKRAKKSLEVAQKPQNKRIR